jgi:hypothetical protein
MKRNLKYTIIIVLIIFFTGFLYKKFYLENNDIVKIPSKSIFTQRLVTPAEKPKQIDTDTSKNKVSYKQIPEKLSTGLIDKNNFSAGHYMSFNEISDITGYDTKKLSSILTDGGKYFTIDDLRPFFNSKKGDTFSIVLDGYEFKGKVVSADKHIFDSKSNRIVIGTPIDEMKKYEYGYVVSLRINLSEENIQDYISISANSEGNITGEIEYIAIRGNGYKFHYNNGIGVFMTMHDYNKSFGEKYDYF